MYIYLVYISLINKRRGLDYAGKRCDCQSKRRTLNTNRKVKEPVQHYKNLKIGETYGFKVSKNPMGKIKAIIRYARNCGKFFEINENKRHLTIRRIK